MPDFCILAIASFTLSKGYRKMPGIDSMGSTLSMPSRTKMGAIRLSTVRVVSLTMDLMDSVLRSLLNLCIGYDHSVFNRYRSSYSLNQVLQCMSALVVYRYKTPTFCCLRGYRTNTNHLLPEKSR